jgi:phage baseplate assembly protein W
MMSEEILGRDLRLAPGAFGFGLTTDLGDLETAAGIDNLVQALLVRFNTPIGELSALGHPDYGSRLHDLIGQLNNATTRNLVRLFTLETLRQEPRVGEVHHLSVELVAGRPDLVLVSIQLTAIDTATPLNLVFNVNLEGVP